MNYDLDADDFGAEFDDFSGPGGANQDGVMVGIPVTTVAATTQQVIRVNVTKPFRCERLCLSATARTAGFLITQISISSEEQNISPDPTPGELFTNDATHRLRGTIVRPGVGINITVNNTTAGPLVFSGAFFGPALSK